MDTLAAAGKALVAILTPLLTLLGIGSRRQRLRSDIRENLALVKELQSDDVLRNHTPATGWLQGRIAIDVARLAGQPLGNPKKPIPWGSVVFALVLAGGFGFWTYRISQDGFEWYGVFPAVIAALMLISVAGMTTNRELPTNEDDALPLGAVPVRTDTAEEHIATSIALLANSDGEVAARFAETGQIGASLNFFNAMREGRYLDGLSFADDLWLRCRVEAWVWNNRAEFGDDPVVLEGVATRLIDARDPVDLWASFVAFEAAQFRDTWGPIDPERLGAASRRRRLSRDHDLVVLAPTGNTGGYFVTAATAIPNALTFVVRRRTDRWLVVNHLGTAPPVPGWPPTWWAPNDSTVNELPES